jgi:hypothetical protein
LFQKKLEFGNDIAISESCPTLFVDETALKQLWDYEVYLFLSAIF